MILLLPFMVSLASLVGAIASGFAIFAVDNKSLQLTFIFILFLILIVYAYHALIHFGDLRVLSGRWHCYHLTKDSQRGRDPFWQEGTFRWFVDPISLSLVGVHHDYEPSRLYFYLIYGHVRSGYILFIEKILTRGVNDDTFGYFDYRRETPIFGYWIGRDYAKKPVVGPYVLSREPIGTDDLNAKFAAAKVDWPPPEWIGGKTNV